MWSANDAKLISILVVSLCSYVTGLLPGILGLGSRCQKSTLLSSVLCFGGGVLLATSIVHILPETRESLNKWAEVVFCCGFFGIYCLDVLVHYLNYSPESEASEEVVNSEEQALNNCCVNNYGAIKPEPCAARRRRASELSIEPVGQIASNGSCNWTTFGLLIAFSVHAVLEGLVIGVQSSPNSVMLLLGAVSCHKLVVAFCLGAELSSDGRPLYTTIPPLSIYVVGSALGIALGMLLHKYQTDPHINISLPIMQSLAGGTLLYIVMSEILPRERSRDLPPYATAMQFISIILGFSLMVTLSFVVDHGT